MGRIPPSSLVPGTQQALRWLAQPYEFLDECASTHGDAFTLDLGSYGAFAVLSRPEEVAEVFAASADALHAGGGNAILGPFLGEGSLLMLEEEDHRRERRLLLPAFGRKALSAHAALIHRIADQKLAELEPHTTISVQRVMQEITLEVIARVIFGLSEDEAGGAHERRAVLMRTTREFLDDPKFNLGLIGKLEAGFDERPAFVEYREKLSTIRALLSEEIVARREGHARGPDVLSLLLDACYDDGRAISNAGLRDELLTLLVTGYETTATALAWSFHFLDVEDDIRRELTETLADLPVEEAALHPLVEGFVKEVLRIRPIIPIVARKVRRTIQIGRFEFEPGMTVAPCVYLVHRRSDLFPDPDRFDPHRFETRRYSGSEYLPFGGGVRRCLGMGLALMEIRIVLARAARTVELRGLGGDERRPVRRSVTVAPSGGTRMRVLPVEG